MGVSLKSGGGGMPGGRRRRVTRHAPMSEINVTPFVDVMLVLLIIFMVTAPLLTAGVPVELPQSKGKPLESSKDVPLTITVDEKGRIFLQDTDVTSENIVEKLKAIAKGQFDKPIFIRGHKALPYGTVMQVMGQISAAGFKRVSLVTDLEVKG
ncbi:MAG: protein TolR [Hyphomicrobiaceae bacterium]